MKRMITAAFVGVAATAMLRAAAPGAASCSQLTALTLPDIRIVEATPVAAADGGPLRAAHCRVNGVIGTETRFTLLLPDQWNNKFFMGGGGGFVGSVQNSAAGTVNQG